MRRFLKFFSWITAFFLILIGATILYLYFSTSNSRSGQIVLNGLQGKVVIDWDRFGIPHITAYSSDSDAFFALGYVHAQDRFWQMELDRCIVQGTLSEIFGSATLKQDEFLRTWGFYRAAQTAWPALDKPTQALIHSYTEGVNAFLQHGHLPLEFKLLRYQPKPWTDIDSIAWSKMMAFDLQNIWQQKIFNYQIVERLGKNQIPVLLPPYPVNAPTVLSEQDLRQSGLLKFQKQVWPILNKRNKISAQQLSQLSLYIQRVQHSLGFQNYTGKGSNEWVISGRFTASGKPLLANDPHLSLAAPATWYLVELKGPTLHVVGATLPGLPGVVIGHNDAIAWGMTNVNPNTQELYLEPSTADFQILHEMIKVKGQKTVDWPVYLSKEGPIINKVSQVGSIQQPVALKWTALFPGRNTP